MIPSLLNAVAHFPHGDLSMKNLIIHNGNKKFSIIDPAIFDGPLFFTNTENYPIVPPLFYQPKQGYCNFSDQLAIGLILYKLLTGTNPLINFKSTPFWARENGFGNGIGGCITDDIFSVITKIPESWNSVFNFEEYNNAIKNQLKVNKIDITTMKNDFKISSGIINHHIDFPLDFFEIKPPKQINNDISNELSDFCMELIFNYAPVKLYNDKIQSVLEFNRN